MELVERVFLFNFFLVVVAAYLPELFASLIVTPLLLPALLPIPFKWSLMPHILIFIFIFKLNYRSQPKKKKKKKTMQNKREKPRKQSESDKRMAGVISMYKHTYIYIYLCTYYIHTLWYSL